MLRKALGGLAAAALATAGLALASFGGVPAGAASICAGGTFVVTSTTDSGAGSLRQAFADASAANGGTICIDSPVVPGPITITSGVLDYTGTGPLTIQGNGKVVLGNNTSAMIHASVTGDVLEIHDLTVTGGNASAGAGVRSGNGSVLLVDSTVTGNTASSFGAGVSGPTVTVVRSTISNNTVTDGDGAGINAGNATVINSTIAGNSAATQGGGIEAGISVTLVYATVVGNTSPVGANILVNNDEPLGSFASVVAQPLGGGMNCDVVLPTDSAGYNYSDGDSCGFTATGDVENGASPQLGALAANGGPTETMLPAESSPLVDAIPVANCHDDGASSIDTDQRGVARPQRGGCDIGAVELAAETPVTPVTPVGPAAPTPVAARPAFTG
jgi:hypothetical protein